MNKTKTIDIENIKLSSTVFPTAEDMALWQSLSDEERLAIIERDEEEAYQSGIAPHVSKEELIARFRLNTPIDCHDFGFYETEM